MSDNWEGERAPTQKPWTEVMVGVLLVPIMHAFFGGLLWALSLGFGAIVTGNLSLTVVPLFYLLGLSITQIGYVLPAFLIAYRVRRNVAAGIAIGALLTVSLQGACYGAFCLSNP